MCQWNAMDGIRGMNDHSASLRASEWVVRDIAQPECENFIKTFHYSKGCSRTAVYRHGLFHKDSDYLCGAILWLPPTKNCAVSVNPDNWTRVLSLSRLAIHPAILKNGESFLIGRSIRMIKKLQKWKSLVTFADMSQGHTGTIYRATNWEYVGESTSNIRWVDSEGRQVSVLSTKSRSVAEMKALGYVNTGRFRKHKFVMHI